MFLTHLEIPFGQDTGLHFRHTIVETTDGRHVLIDGVPQGLLLTDQYVKWRVRTPTAEEIAVKRTRAKSASRHQTFPIS
jgi:hypothetical protein